MTDQTLPPTRIGDVAPTGSHEAAEPVFSPPPLGPGQSLTDLLREAVTEKVEDDPITLIVAARPNVSVSYSSLLDDEMRKRWLKACTTSRRGKPDEVDELRFACTVLANQCLSINMQGQVAPATDGRPLTFALKELWEMVGGHDPISTIRKLYGRDPAILSTVEAVLERCGYGDEAQEDPTTAS